MGGTKRAGRAQKNAFRLVQAEKIFLVQQLPAFLCSDASLIGPLAGQNEKKRRTLSVFVVRLWFSSEYSTDAQISILWLLG